MDDILLCNAWHMFTDLAYTAGFLDGEGHVGMTKWGTSWLPVLIITNTDRRVIDWLVERYGGKVYIHDRRNSVHKPRFNWRLVGKHATTLLEQVLPYLILKRQQAELCLRYYSEGGNFHDGNNRLPHTEYKRRRQLHAELKELNRRGT